MVKLAQVPEQSEFSNGAYVVAAVNPMYERGRGTAISSFWLFSTRVLGVRRNTSRWETIVFRVNPKNNCLPPRFSGQPEKQWSPTKVFGLTLSHIIQFTPQELSAEPRTKCFNAFYYFLHTQAAVFGVSASLACNSVGNPGGGAIYKDAWFVNKSWRRVGLDLASWTR